MSPRAAKIQTSEVFRPLWTERARFKGAWGGRGSGKSNDRAQDLLMRMLSEPGVRVACIREVQNSIKDSVHQLLKDWINRMGVADQFTILETEIRTTGGSVCIFKGMKDQNAESIKSMEGVKYCWWEEAQTASETSIRLLRPTIRVPGSEIWFTWNPRKRTDPVDQLLRGGAAEDHAIVVEAQYRDNPWFPDELELERQIDLKGNEENYKHVWLGAYQSEADMQFISDKSVEAARIRPAVAYAHDELVMGVDVARFGDDKSVIKLRRGRDARSIPSQKFEKMDTMTFAAKVADAIVQHRPDGVFVDEGGIGGGVIDRLRQLGHEVIGINFGGAADRFVPGAPKTKNKRSEMWGLMRMDIDRGLAVEDSDRLMQELTGPQYSYDEANAIQLEKKRDMKKRGIASPDEADALALTYAYPVEARSISVQQAEAEAANYDPIWS